MRAVHQQLCGLLLMLYCGTLLAEDGYDLWLRYPRLSGELATQLETYASSYSDNINGTSATTLAAKELVRGIKGLSGRTLTFQPNNRANEVTIDFVRTAGDYFKGNGGRTKPSDGFALKASVVNRKKTISIYSETELGHLYGVFELLRQFQTNHHMDQLDITSNPALQLRVLDHWDNLDRKVERGYAGLSLWDWEQLPGRVDARYTDYARANASIGINGVVLNNVNANARILTAEYLPKVAAIAGALRPWGIKVYLSARFSAPVEIGGLNTADPLDTAVQQWWKQKADEIYTLIPDFGGLLVKANSEGQPGPGDYHRTHADGANMLAAALKPHGGVVMWRAFVYSDVDPDDRAKQAYSEFKPLDGKFADNVLLQVKNGPIDFQPREPFHPLFGAMPNTPLMPELQITKEYLGFATHLVYLGPLFQEVLQADTHARGNGSTVANIVTSTRLTGIAGVANIGTDRNWTGSIFNQANWYAFGRLAWNPDDSSDRIADEWLAQTFSSDPAFVDTAGAMMRLSREAVVDYMTPLGLAHLMGTSHHYGPAPWVSDQKRPEWNPVYYQHVDQNGIGFDRTARGSNALAQYAPAAAAKWSDPASIDDKFLLWFHHVPWQYRLRSGQTVWESLVRHYDLGVSEVEAMTRQWDGLEPFVDAERFGLTRDFLRIQLQEAQWWRDACIAWFMSVSGLPLPTGVKAPAQPLQYYQLKQQQIKDVP